MLFFKSRKYDLMGSISTIPIEVLMQFLGFSKLSGVLLLTNPRHKSTVFFHEGIFIWATIDSRKGQLGQRLISSSAITDKQLRECLAIQKKIKPHTRIGNILVSKGFLNSDLLNEHLKNQAKDIFFDVLDWRDGEFKFKVINDIPDDLFRVNEHIERIILEKMVMKDDHHDSLSFEETDKSRI